MRSMLLVAALALCASAQGLTDIPPILQIIRKPGIGGPVRPYPTAKAAVDAIAMTAMTGLPETWTVEMHGSFGSVEDLDKAIGAVLAPVSPYAAGSQDDLLAPSRTLIALYQTGWSYRPQEALRRLSRAHYYHVTVYGIRPGSGGDLGELMRLRRHEMDSVNLDRPDLVYRVISGAPSGMYLILAPMISLKAMDEGIAKMPVYAEPLATAEAAAVKIAASQELSREHFLFRVEPRLSYVSDAFAEGDAPFWHPKQ